MSTTAALATWRRNFTLLPTLILYDLYFTGSHNSFSVVLCLRESISFWVPSSPMESFRRSSTFNDLFLNSISANAVAPLTPIGLCWRYKHCRVLFTLRALANWHAPSASMSHCSRSRWARVWFVFSTEVSEIVFWRENCETTMLTFSSVVFWWSPLMISSTASGGRALWPVRSGAPWDLWMMITVHWENNSLLHQFEHCTTTTLQVSYDLSMMWSVGQPLPVQCWDCRTSWVFSVEACVGWDWQGLHRIVHLTYC